MFVAAAACTTSEPEPEQERAATISELSGIEWLYSANSRVVLVTLKYDHRELGACAILGSDFGGRVNGTPMVVSQRGSWRGPEIEDDCNYPSLALERPAIVGSASIEVGDSSRTVTIPLDDLLAPSSVEIVPEMPWQFTNGQQVTLRWSPASDLTRNPSIKIADGGGVGSLEIHDDLVTFTMPTVPFLTAGKLELHTARSAPSPACAGCRFFPTPRFILPFTYQYR
jgi:hypothetical protein